MDVRLGIGIIAINGVPLMVTGTPDHIQSMCPRYAILSPGLTKKEHLANKIYKNTGMSTDDLLAVLPEHAMSSKNRVFFTHQNKPKRNEDIGVALFSAPVAVQ